MTVSWQANGRQVVRNVGAAPFTRIQDPRILDPGSRLLDPGSRILAGSRILDPGCQVPDPSGFGYNRDIGMGQDVRRGSVSDPGIWELGG